MAASVNKVILIGNLGKDPETRYTPDGAAITNITLATTDTWKDKATGEKKEATEWHRVSFFGRLAEIAGQYLKKGRPVYIEGRIRTRKWQDKEGQDRYTTEIIADEMKMLGSREGMGAPGGDDDGGGARAPVHAGNAGGGGGGGAAARPAAAKKPAGGFDDMDDDIPF